MVRVPLGNLRRSPAAAMLRALTKAARSGWPTSNDEATYAILQPCPIRAAAGADVRV